MFSPYISTLLTMPPNKAPPPPLIHLPPPPQPFCSSPSRLIDGTPPLPVGRAIACAQPEVTPVIVAAANKATVGGLQRLAAADWGIWQRGTEERRWVEVRTGETQKESVSL